MTVKAAFDPIDAEEVDLSRPLCAPALPCHVLTALDACGGDGTRGVIAETASLEEAPAVVSFISLTT